ncbi:SAM-dependent methyltransferase [Paracandidimonas soli]|uniref:O-methyltransferase n=1 Tax=Paracandidimonas soli TaxID=1917182 RepID=A0A4R3UWU0_9BURK|nr:class I SAM-dependent methyltransferase [Paracandidimonas soli]TCU95253.1 hypothetical protein EV686_10896 [Paracandidimonas soli]
MELKVHKSVMDQLNEPQAMAAIRRVSDGYKSFQALLAGFRCGLFDWLAQHGPAARPDIASALDLRGAHLAGFLQALEDLGALSRADGGYVLADGMDQVLCKGNPWYQGAVFEDMLAGSNGWSSLDRFMSASWTAAEAARPALAPRQHPFFGEADRLASYLRDHLAARQGALRVLCFDGGEGQLAVALCRQLPGAVVTAVVAEQGLEQARAAVAASGFEQRCSVRRGSALTPLEGEYDLGVLFHALYPLRRNTNDALAAVAGRLAPEGELFCAHWFCLEACDTAPGGLRDLDKAVLTDSHPMCHVETFCERFGKIGLLDADRADLHGEYGVTKLHFARKPEASQE